MCPVSFQRNHRCQGTTGSSRAAGRHWSLRAAGNRGPRADGRHPSAGLKGWCSTDEKLGSFFGSWDLRFLVGFFLWRRGCFLRISGSWRWIREKHPSIENEYGLFTYHVGTYHFDSKSLRTTSPGENSQHQHAANHHLSNYVYIYLYVCLSKSVYTNFSFFQNHTLINQPSFPQLYPQTFLMG